MKCRVKGWHLPVREEGKESANKKESLNSDPTLKIDNLRNDPLFLFFKLPKKQTLVHNLSK